MMDSWTNVARQTARLKVGDPLDSRSDVGAVSSADQLDKNLGFVARAEAEGARLRHRRQAHSGRRPAASTWQPTVFENVTPEMTLAREEVSGRCWRHALR